MMKECKYRLPCGWCDRRNQRCEMEAKAIATIEKYDPATKSILADVEKITVTGSTISSVDAPNIPPEEKTVLDGLATKTGGNA